MIKQLIFFRSFKVIALAIIGDLALFHHQHLIAALPPLSQNNFAEIRAQILPSDAESSWKKIPWQNDLTQALEQAQNEQRPVVIWAMNGDPLGCT